MGTDVSYQPVICIDFDGVLHRYSKGWNGGVIYDPPMPGAREALEELSKHGRLVVLTARGSSEYRSGGCEPEHAAVWAWLKEHGLADLIDEVTCVKPGAVVYIDDRAVHFDGDWEACVEVVNERFEGVKA